MRPRQTLAFKLVGTGVCFLLIALTSIGLTLLITWQLEGGAAAVNEAGRLRMLTYRAALAVASGNQAALAPQVQAVDSTIELLRAGDPSRPLFAPWTDESLAEFATVRRQWLALRADWNSGGQQVSLQDVDALASRVDGLVSLIERRLSHWTDVLRGVQFAMVGLAIAGAVLLTYAAQLLVLGPLQRLEQAMGAIRAGDFSARVSVRSSDEFGELADGFNSMAARLQALYGDLAAKVREKTAHLELERERLAALYEVSAIVARAETLDELARGLVGTVRRAARADAAAIRWSDESNLHYLMLAQEGLPPSLASDEQCLPSGNCHCGQRAATAHTQLIRIAPDDEGRLACQRNGFRTLLTVPVSLHQRVLGEIDLFYRGAHEFAPADRALVETLASHLAGGIEGLRATAADKEAAIAGERSLIAQELHDSIAQSLAFLKIQVELLRGALRRRDDADITRTLAEIDTGVRESYGDVRELLLHFRTRTNAEDIQSALRTTLQKFEHQTGLPVELQIDGHGVPLPTDVQIQVLHVLQEALSNVRKHAGASRVRVQVQQTPQWQFDVIDDGKGFDTRVQAGESHVGLRIMRERAMRIGAQVNVQSQAGAGTRVSITVPRDNAASEMTNEA